MARRRFRRRVKPRNSNDQEQTSSLIKCYNKREEKTSGYAARRRYCPRANVQPSVPQRQERGSSSYRVVCRKRPSTAGLDTSASKIKHQQYAAKQKNCSPANLQPFVPQRPEGSSSSGPVVCRKRPSPAGLDTSASKIKRQQYSTEQKGCPPANVQHSVPRRPEGPPSSSTVASRKRRSPAGLDTSASKIKRQYTAEQKDFPPAIVQHAIPRRSERPASKVVSRKRRRPAGLDTSASKRQQYAAKKKHYRPASVQHSIPRRPEGPPSSCTAVSRKRPSPADLDPSTSRFKRQHLSDGDGMGQFDGLSLRRPDRPISQQHPVWFDRLRTGPRYFEYFNKTPGPGSGLTGFQQHRPPNQIGPIGFEDSGPIHYNKPIAMAPAIYEKPIPPQQNFHMAHQPFREPMNPEVSAVPMTFPDQPTLQQTPNLQPAPPFSQQGPTHSYHPAVPAVGMQQPGNMMTLNQPALPQNPVPSSQNPQVDVNNLLSKLIASGVIKPSQPIVALTSGTASVAVNEEEVRVEVKDDIPDLTSFPMDYMKKHYESDVTKLYSGKQCSQCSKRFTTSENYSDHLDWHFREAHAKKKRIHRRWYYSLKDWVECDIADLEDEAKSKIFEEEKGQKNKAAAKKKFQSVKATKNQVAELCEICQEAFETYWAEEEEDWFLKDAVRVGNKNFHPICYEDDKNSACMSPNKADHPLSALLKEGTEEECTSCSVAAATVKQEVEPQTMEWKKEKKDILSDDVHSHQKV